MSLTIRCPDAKAMELGGVDTGSMKAYEHPTVAGIMKYRGFTDTCIACGDRRTTFRIWDSFNFTVFQSASSVRTQIINKLNFW